MQETKMINKDELRGVEGRGGIERRIMRGVFSERLVNDLKKLMNRKDEEGNKIYLEDFGPLKETIDESLAIPKKDKWLCYDREVRIGVPELKEAHEVRRIS